MNSKLFCFVYTCVNKQSETEYIMKLDIPDIKWLLENQTNREIRTEKTKIEEGNNNGCELQVKIQFAGDDNEWIKIYYKTNRSVFVTCKLQFNLNVPTVFNKQKHWASKNKWKLITTQPKKNILAYYPSENIVFHFIFLVHHNNINKINITEAVIYPQPEENYSMLNQNGNLNSDLASLLMNKDFSDITIKSVDGDEIPAHKCFLAVHSPVFKAIFDHNTVESLTNIVESPFETKVLKNMLSYIYTGNAPKLDDDDEMPLKLLKAADFYQLKRLKRLCETVLEDFLTVENAITMLELAVLYRAKYLKKKTLEFISEGLAGEITQTKTWQTLQSVEIIKSIYKFILVK